MPADLLVCQAGPGSGGAGQGPRHGHPAAVHYRRVLLVLGRGRPPRQLASAHVRRPRVDYESHAVALDRNELGALLVAAGLGPPGEHALISLLALNGLRVSEATGADIEHLGLERGHRAGIGKAVTPHTLRHAFITAVLDAGVPLRDVQEAASHADPRTTMRYDRARGSLDRHATYIVAAYLAGAAR